MKKREGTTHNNNSRQRLVYGGVLWPLKEKQTYFFRKWHICHFNKKWQMRVRVIEHRLKAKTKVK